MVNTAFKKILAGSIICHLAVFSLFSLSLNNRSAYPQYTSFCFLSRLFAVSPIMDLAKFKFKNGQGLFFTNQNLPWINKLDGRSVLPVYAPYKPIMKVQLRSLSGTVAGKENLPNNFGLILAPPKRKGQEIMLHPVLPYDFSLYFSDRQIAHVELMFSVGALDNPNYIKVKRRVSCGNLEVDLLSMRYIERYLFIQHMRFQPASWQTVKIDLSGKND